MVDETLFAPFSQNRPTPSSPPPSKHAPAFAQPASTISGRHYPPAISRHCSRATRLSLPPSPPPGSSEAAPPSQKVLLKTPRQVPTPSPIVAAPPSPPLPLAPAPVYHRAPPTAPWRGAPLQGSGRPRPTGRRG